MGRYKKPILFIVAILLLLALYVMLSGEKTINKLSIKKNEIIIDNFELAKVIDNDNNYYKLNAESAVIDRETKAAKLNRFTLVYKKGDTALNASAERGHLLQEVRMDASGKIRGRINEFDFETGESGTFHYDFDTGKGEVKGDVFITGKKGTIRSDRALIDHKENILEFMGNVEVNFNN